LLGQNPIASPLSMFVGSAINGKRCPSFLLWFLLLNTMLEEQPQKQVNSHNLASHVCTKKEVYTEKKQFHG
jgi:hypothetical protein